VPLTSKIERRVFDVAELRLTSEEDMRTIRGYAAVFDSMSQPIYGFREVIRKGAFRKTLRESDIRALWNHDPNFVLGRKSARTLRLDEDEKGLLTRIFPPSTTWASDLMMSIERGDVSQMSFGFQMVKDQWLQPGQDGLPVRELLEVRLFDVSPVTFPAYQQTEVHVRSLMDSVLTRIERGGVSADERHTMRLAIQNILHALDAEPDARHSAQEPEPGLPHSSAKDWRDAVLAKRKRLMAVLG
jgi:HK97 family phage prohead protease